MKIEKGGTDMWCPGCKKIATCKAIPAPQVTDDTGDYDQRWYKSDHPDVHRFQRGRKCLSCDHEFVTGEADLGFLDELVELRDSLAEIKQNAQEYVRESKEASKSLAKLSRSLNILRSLRLYKES